MPQTNAAGQPAESGEGITAAGEKRPFPHRRTSGNAHECAQHAVATLAGAGDGPQHVARKGRRAARRRTGGVFKSTETFRP
jgi:hypothetical protein